MTKFSLHSSSMTQLLSWDWLSFSFMCKQKRLIHYYITSLKWSSQIKWRCDPFFLIRLTCPGVAGPFERPYGSRGTKLIAFACSCALGYGSSCNTCPPSNPHAHQAKTITTSRRCDDACIISWWHQCKYDGPAWHRSRVWVAGLCVQGWDSEAVSGTSD